MITKENFKNVLIALNFKQDGKKFFKQFEDDYQLIADFGTETLIYPEDLKTGRRTTANFTANENFVVFECVARLMAKGYKPEKLQIVRRQQRVEKF